MVVDDKEITVLKAYTQDKLTLPESPGAGALVKLDGVAIPEGYAKVESVDREIRSDDPSDTLFTLEIAIEGADIGPWDEEILAWLYDSQLACRDARYDMMVLGILAEEGKLLGHICVFFVPQDAEFGQCSLQLPDGPAIVLAPFFE